MPASSDTSVTLQPFKEIRMNVGHLRQLRVVVLLAMAAGTTMPAGAAPCCAVVGQVHAPSGAPVAHAQLTLRGPRAAAATTDEKGNFSLELPPGQYDLTVVARGYGTVTVNTGQIVEGAHLDVVLEPSDAPKLRTI